MPAAASSPFSSSADPLPYGIASVTGLAASIGVGLVFVTAGVGQLRHRRLLSGVIANYRLLPDALVGGAARLLPVAELLIGGALIVGERTVAPLAAILLLLVFAVAMAINIRRGRSHIDCGCGHAELRQPLGWPLVMRNLLLAAMLAPRPIADSTPDDAGSAVAIAAGISLFLTYLIFNAVTALSASSPARPTHSHR